jgi:hypothetical protein
MRRAWHELVSEDDAIAWIRETVASSLHVTEVLPCAAEDGRRTLEWLQVSTRSPFGAIALHTGGLLVDDGWLRVLGAGCDRLPRTLESWNGTPPRLALGLLVADDALGGSFAWFREPTTIHYLAPDTLRWEDLGLGYTDWLATILGDGLRSLYASLRWEGWQDEVLPLAGDRALLVWPPLVAAGPPLAERARRSVPMTEVWGLYQQLAEELAELPDGARFEVRVPEG